MKVGWKQVEWQEKRNSEERFVGSASQQSEFGESMGNWRAHWGIGLKKVGESP